MFSYSFSAGWSEVRNETGEVQWLPDEEEEVADEGLAQGACVWVCMCMCACVWVWVCVCLSVGMRVLVCGYACVCVWVCVFECGYACVWVWVCVCLSVGMRVFECGYACVWVWVCMWLSMRLSVYLSYFNVFIIIISEILYAGQRDIHLCQVVEWREYTCTETM